MFGASKFNSLLKHPGYNAPLIPIAASVIGGVAANSAAKKSSKAANTAANAQTEAARVAAEEARFKPIDYSNAFGNVNWLKDASGNVVGTTGGPSAAVQGMSNDAMGNYNLYKSLFGQYYNPSLAAGGQQIYNEQQGLIAPTRQTQQSQLFDALQAKGITGIQGYDPRTGQGTNPLAQSLFSSWAGQDAQMSANSINEYLSRIGQLQSMQNQAQGTWTGINELPINNVLGVSTGIGGRNANAQGSSALMQGISNAGTIQAQGQMAQANNQANFWNSFIPQATKGIQGLFSSSSSGTGGGFVDTSGSYGTTPATGGYTGDPMYSFSGSNLGSNW
jgi:hypothetical protein